MSRVSRFLLALACAGLIARGQGQGTVQRVVILKVDGLPADLVQRNLEKLPWIRHVFVENGATVDNFYVRGLSLSAPSWSILDTGQHLQIRGNAEWDRYTLRVHDYLNFFPFYLGYAVSKRVDMPGVELLDDFKVPLLIDRFPYEQQLQSFQMLQRGVRWTTLQSTLSAAFKRSPKDIFDEWQTGFSLSGGLNKQTETELIEKLSDPKIRYLDFFTGDYDHVAHLTSDRVTQLHSMQEIDALVGRVWNAIAASPLADSTALVLVSDHGMNTSESVYSQGYNLIDWFTSAAGGGHHVLTNRHPMTEFKLKGLDPFVTEVITPSAESQYLAGDADRYPTVVLDLDGNERANVSLRNNTLNQLHILLDQLVRRKLPGRVRHAVLESFFKILDGVRPAWRRNVETVQSELQAAPRIEPGGGVVARRSAAQAERLKSEQRALADYARVITRLLGLDPADFDPGKFKMDELIPRKSLGEPNTLADLRHYVVGIAAGGLVVAADGTLDLDRSFRYVDYFAALTALSVRNNVQRNVSPRPIDFIAARNDAEDGVVLWGGPDREAAIETRRDDAGHLELRYVTGAADGGPLEIADRDWHDERDWLRLVHTSKYSNAIVGLPEEMLLQPGASRRERLRQADFVIFARDHWNFNVRGFNPGGNHGGFLRISTHSVLMFAGGNRSGVPRGLRIAEPYDSLSLVPTILALMGKPDPALPGPPISELFPSVP